MKTIVIARHAKSDWSQGLPDFDRPLNSRGQKDAPMMGKVLAENGFEPDIILSSPARRAKETAIHIAKALNFKEEILFDRGIYDNGDAHIISLIRKLDDASDTAMVFGHNPIQESVVERLLGMSGSITMPTGSLVCVEAYTQSWNKLQPGNCSLKWFLIPKSIKRSLP